MQLGRLSFIMQESNIFTRLTCIPMRTMRKKKRAQKDKPIPQWQKEIHEEKKEYKQKIKDLRKQFGREYWEAQTLIENKWLEKYNTEAATKCINDQRKLRKFVVKSSFQTEKHLNFLVSNEQAIKEKHARHKARLNLESEQRRLTLEALEIDSQNWPTLNNLDIIDRNTQLPNVILNETNYYEKLSQMAFFVEQGRFEELEKIINNEEIVKYKNSLLKPLYRELKSVIRYISHTDEYKIYNDFYSAVSAALSNHSFILTTTLETELISLCGTYREKYEEVLKEREGYSVADNLAQMEESLNNLCQLIFIWSRYTSLMYKSDIEMHNLNSMSTRELEAAYKGTMREQAETEEALGRFKGLYDQPTTDTTQEAEDVANVEEDKDEGYYNTKGQNIDEGDGKSSDKGGLEEYAENLELKGDRSKMDILQQMRGDAAKHTHSPQEHVSEDPLKKIEEEIDMEEGEPQLNIYGERISDQQENIFNIDDVMNSENVRKMLDTEDVFDFHKRKGLFNLNPFDEEDSTIGLGIIEESIQCGSMVLDNIQQQIENIVPLEIEDGEKKQKLLELTNKLQMVKIADPRILLKIYKMFAYPQPSIATFNYKSLQVIDKFA